MPFIAFNEWAPDAATVGNPGMPALMNAIPGLNSYKPFPSLVTQTDALDNYPRGAIEAIDNAGNTFQYAGDEQKLYALVGGSWTDATRTAGGAYSTAAGERWEFVRWKEQVLATNFNDEIQTIGFSGGNFADLTSAVQARHIAVVGNFVVLGNTTDSTDGEQRDRVRWCAFDDETDWTPNPVTGAAFRNLKTGGGIQRIVGGEYGIIVSERNTWRMSYVGAPTWFNIAEIGPGIGALAPGGVVVLGDTIFVWSEHGMYAFPGGGRPTPIGEGKVDDYLRADLDESYLHRVSSVADPKSGLVFWAYPGAGNTGGAPNKIVVYNTKTNRWGHADQACELIWRSGGVSTTLEELDAVSPSIDDLGISLDSAQWKGGAPVLAGFNASFENGNFRGAPLTARVTSRETELSPYRRTNVNNFVPMVDGGTITARIGSRQRLQDTVDWTSPLEVLPSGRIPCRVNRKYMRFELTITGAWNDAIGIRVEQPGARASSGL